MAQPTDIFLFSYGTLQLEAVQLRSFGRLLAGAPDIMPGYRQEMVEITDPDVIKASGETFHPIVIASAEPTDKIKGTLFKITKEELEAADRYEVADYKRVEVQLESGQKAWVYIKA